MATKITPNATQILRERYLIWDTQGTVCETPNQLFRRVSDHVASAEKKDKKIWSDIFFKVMENLEFLPNSPTLMNAGLPKGQLSACFVLPVEDSLEAIFTTLKNAALIHQSGGGTGYNFSKLRPKDDIVSSSGGKSSGPIAFMKVYDAATEYVKQGGKRRGANMGILNINHPDIEAFINSKSDGKSLQNFNISVGITDDFMDAVEKNANWALINPRTQKIQQRVNARNLWHLIAEQAQKTGDPGLLFFDAINRENPLPKQGKIQTTNPCGEVPLLDYESCNLGSINLSKMIYQENDRVEIDWKRLEETVKTAIRFLDNVISSNHYTLTEIQEKTLSNRKIGLGIMGWAELLILLNIPYASDEAVILAEKLMKFIKSKSYEASSILAKERGNFPSWKESSYVPSIPLRNATCNSIAPTGSISVIANTSYSIEPLYALAYKRVGILNGKTQTEINELFMKKMKLLGFWTDVLREEVISKGSIQHLEFIPHNIKKLFETSLKIPWRYHLLHQQAFQKYTDNAVSKTINLPKKTSTKEISDIYRTAWEYGLKGITVYRDGSKTNQLFQKCGIVEPQGC